MKTRGGYIREMRQTAISRLGGCCVFCGGMDNLHIHHIRPINRGGGRQGRGSYIRARNLKNEVDAGVVILVCEYCHGQIHNEIVPNALNVEQRFRRG